MVRIGLLLFAVFISEFVSGQNQRVVDSLHEVLVHKTGADRYSALYRLAVEHLDVDNRLALQIVQEAEQAALISKDTASIVRALRLRGQILFRLNKIGELIVAYSTALPLAEQIDAVAEYVLIANIFGNAYLYQSRFDKALQYYLLAHQGARKAGDVALMGMVIGNIGITYYKLKDYSKARHYLLESHAMKKASGTLGYDTPMNLSLCYFQLREFVNASRFLDESLIICGNECSPQSMTHIKYASGCIALGTNDFNKARAEFIDSFRFAKGTGDQRMQLDNIYMLVGILIQRRHISEAEYYLQEGMKIVEQGVSFHLEMIKLYARFSELYLSIDDFKKASLYQAKYIALKDSIYNEALTTNLMKIESRFMERQNEQKLAEQEELIMLKEHMIQRQYWLNIVTTLLAIISILFVAFLFRDYRRKRVLNRVLEGKVRERTLELEVNRNELFNALKRRDLFFRNAMANISDMTNTIEGLCCIGMRDVSDPVAQSYLDKVTNVTAQLAGCLKSFYDNQLIDT